MEANPEVLGLDVSGLLGLFRGEVDDPQLGGDLAQDADEPGGDVLASRRELQQ
ncbi:hypothetical protein [Streptomyces sp. NPDC016626]|uniref:hypothetical protein n=1 Tax=Streptomyces sp. NPDC016626 TaxID=3364968 RepID=UPI0036F9FBDB